MGLNGRTPSVITGMRKHFPKKNFDGEKQEGKRLAAHTSKTDKCKVLDKITKTSKMKKYRVCIPVGAPESFNAATVKFQAADVWRKAVVRNSTVAMLKLLEASISVRNRKKPQQEQRKVPLPVICTLHM